MGPLKYLSSGHGVTFFRPQGGGRPLPILPIALRRSKGNWPLKRYLGEEVALLGDDDDDTPFRVSWYKQHSQVGDRESFTKFIIISAVASVTAVQGYLAHTKTPTALGPP